MDYTSCMEVYGLREGDFMKNKKYIAKAVMWFLLWAYVITIQVDAIIISKIANDLESVRFLLFVYVMNFLSMYSCSKNLNTYFCGKSMEDKND